MGRFRKAFSIIFATLTLAFSSSAFCQWVPTSGSGSSIIQCFAVKGTTLFAGSNAAGVFRSTDSGISWSAANTGLTDSDVYSFAVIGEKILAGTFNGVFSSTDNGASWVSSGLIKSQVTALLLNGTNLFAATYGYGVFRSTNNGGSWVSIDSGLTDAFLYALLASGEGLYAGTGYRGEGIFLSTDSGSNWAAMNNGLDNAYVWSLTSNGTNIFAGTDGGVFISTNSGTSWSATILTDPYIQSFVKSDTNLFAGSWGGGVLLSTNNGTSWTATNTGLTNTNILSLGASSTNLFAGTSGSGIFRRPLSEMIAPSVVNATTQPVEIPTQVYPNPFLEKTSVRFTMAERGLAQVTIVDLLGQHVAQLFDGELDAGEHSFEWNASGTAAGTYFCVIRANGHTEQKAMVIARELV